MSICCILFITGRTIGSILEKNSQQLEYKYPALDEEDRVVFVANGLDIWEGPTCPVCYRDPNIMYMYAAQYTLPEDLYFMHQYEKYTKNIIKQNYCPPEIPCSSFIIDEELGINVIQ
jgi:hypothetical protein